MSELHAPVVDLHHTLRPTRLDVDLDVLAANYVAIRTHVATEVMPILKANAYGHGLVRVGQLMQELGAPCLGVAYLEEAIHLRRHGVETPVLVLGGILGDQIPLYLEHDVILAASSVDKLLAIEATAERLGVRARVHLKIDTGMERIGIHWYHAHRLVEASLRCRHVDVEGIFSHLANADASDLGHAREQVRRFEEVLALYDERGVGRPRAHLCNSAGLLNLPEARYDLVRPGILLFGVPPAPTVAVSVPVRPALTWVSRVVYFKVVPAGRPVSYGGTWAPGADTRVVTVPVGYGDGYPRRMSGQAEVGIGGRRLPVVGRICMDQVMVDLGPDGTAYNGDEVLLLGERDGVRIDAQELADWAGTIVYEVLTGINTRVPRRYLRQGTSEGGPA